MKLKKLILLAVAVLLLLGLAVAKQRFGGPKSETLDMPSEQTLIESEVESSAVARLEIYRGEGDGEKISITKGDSDKWALSSRLGIRARKEAVENLLAHLSAVRGELRSEDANLLSDYSITDDMGFHFVLSDRDGKLLAHRVVSPMRPRGTQNFVREAGSNKVVVTYTDILSDIGIFSNEDKLSDKTFEDLSLPDDASIKKP